MIRVLHELGSLDGGGVARLLYDYYSFIDHEQVHFDFLIYNYYEQGILEQPLKELGCQVFKVPKIQDGRKDFLRGIDSVLNGNKYDIVHSHRGPQSFYVLNAAKKHGVNVRIAHSHLAYSPESFSRKIKESILIRMDKYLATNLFACGSDAGKSMWGERSNFYVMHNAINLNKFVFSEKVRDEKRKEIGIDNKDELVLGIVGRIEDQKNYPFLMKVMQRLLDKNNATLVVVGRGTLENNVKQMAIELGISDHVKFLGVRNDVNCLLNAFDCFLLPSKYEGLPVVLIEAQANGLYEIVSNTVTKEMAVTDLLTFLPNDEVELWVKKIEDIAKSSNVAKRNGYATILKDNGYSIHDEAIKLQSYYIKLVDE